MALSWEEIRNNAVSFSTEVKKRDLHIEEAHAQTFVTLFLEVFGIKLEWLQENSSGDFEVKVPLDDGHKGYIDFIWKGKILIEMKSLGKDLDKALQQAKNYIIGLPAKDIPPLIMVSDFDNIWIFIRERGNTYQFKTKDLHQKVRYFADIAGYETLKNFDDSPQIEVNVKASRIMAELHDDLAKFEYCGHELEVFLVRILFCLFAEDTEIFEKRSFEEFIRSSCEDGSDLRQRIDDLFEILDTPHDALLRQKVSATLQQFRYINGKLFEEKLGRPIFDAKMRQKLIDCTNFNWSNISPAVFGAMFQGVMDEKLRREMGAHYTSEENILKVLKPLFLDDLWVEFEKVKYIKKELEQFHNKIASLKFLDPACGCGNFLIIAYRELRKLEYAILNMLLDDKQTVLSISSDFNLLFKVNINQFYGIEIEEFPCRVAQVSMWLMEHKMNMLAADQLGKYFIDLPLKSSATIVCDNALTLDWNSVVPKDELSYIIGNPPFNGARTMTDEQKADMISVFGEDYYGVGNLDYVCAWYRKAADMMNKNHNIRTAFVSTNSISQGIHPFLLWKPLEKEGFKIDFAYRTFLWTNEGREMAAVHCVIIAFSQNEINTPKRIFDEQNNFKIVKNINGYLKDASNVYLDSRTTPICPDVPEIGIGNQPIDGGFYIFTKDEMEDFITQEPKSAKWFRPWIGAIEFLKGYYRYCLWLTYCPADELAQMPKCQERIQSVREYRLGRNRANTQRLANTPKKFQVENIPNTRYLVIPAISSERRQYIPIGFVSPEILSSDRVYITDKADLYHFGILSSNVHNAWNRVVCGRLRTDYHYSVELVYNNFPWPTPTPKQKLAIEKAAQAVLDARNEGNNKNCSLATLYNQNIMPDNLRKAHDSLDKAVMKAYGKTSRTWKTELQIVNDLIIMYQELVKKEQEEKIQQKKRTRRRKNI